MNGELNFHLKALTPIWTGDIQGKNNKLQMTGIKGSIRWWYEALIRSFDCYACDPSSGEHILESSDQKHLMNVSPEEVYEFVSKKICPACFLFGCTGWRGKFNLQIKRNGHVSNDSLVPGIASH